MTVRPPPREVPPAAGEARTQVLADAHIRLTVDANRGPRITSLCDDGMELLAVLDPPEIAGPEGGPQVALHGGHRLWAAPEDPDVTYRMDNRPGRLVVDGDTVTASDAGHPVGRELTVAVDDGRARLRHTLHNRGEVPLTIGPWAVTQARPDGTAVLPVGGGQRDPHGLCANGSVVVWPYTDLTDVRFAFHRRWVSVTGGSRSDAVDPTKIGVDGFTPWVAYVVGSSLLVIATSPRPDGGVLADLGSTTQVFTQRRFTELESLAPLTTVAPGGESSLEQVWAVHPNPSPEGGAVDVEAVAEVARAVAAPARR